MGSIRKIWPVREQTVAYDPSGHYAYVLLTGGPIKDYRSDVYLEADGDGTAIRWAATFASPIPGTGAVTRLVLTGLLRYLAGSLAKHAGRRRADCPAHP